MSNRINFNSQQPASLPLTWETAPDEILVRLFSSFTPIDLIHASQTCKHWRVVSQDNTVWKALFKRYFPNVDTSKLTTGQLEIQLLQMDKTRRNMLRNVCSVTHPPTDSNFTWGLTQFGVPVACVLKSTQINLPGSTNSFTAAIDHQGSSIHTPIADFRIENEHSCIHSEKDLLFLGHSQNRITAFRIVIHPLVIPFNLNPVFVFTGHTGTVTALQTWKDKLISGSRDCSIRLWDSNGHCEPIITDQPIESLCVVDDLLFSGDAKGEVKVWDLKTRTCIDTLKIPTHSPIPYVNSLKFERPFLFVHMGAYGDETIKAVILEENKLQLLETIFRGDVGGIAIHNGCLAIASRDDKYNGNEILMDFGMAATIRTTLQDIADCFKKTDGQAPMKRVEHLDNRLKEGIYRGMEKVLLQDKNPEYWYVPNAGKFAFHAFKFKNAERARAIKFFLEELDQMKG